jgi:hypothetical protein
MAVPDLTGTWTLLSYRLLGSRGRVRHPYGEDPVGYLLYMPDGFMAVSIMSGRRENSAWTDIRRQTEDEAALATRTYLSYCGTYELLEDRVFHDIRTSLFPNWTGTRQERFYRLTDGCLELSTAPFDDGLTMPRAHLLWRRVRPR